MNYEIECFRAWLVKSVYWTGVLYGRQFEGVLSARTELMSYRWIRSYGLKLQIRHKDVIQTLTIEGNDPFVYSFDGDIDIDKMSKSIISLVELHYPGIVSENKWASCSICLRTGICNDIGIDTLCRSCQDRIEKSNKDISGFVYIAGNEDSGYYKIGSSNDPNNRVKSFSPRLPFKVTILHQIHAADRLQAEKEIHSVYSSKRKEGEWFSLSKEDLAAIKLIKEW